MVKALLAVALAALVAVASIGATLYFSGRVRLAEPSAAAAKQSAPTLPTPIFVPLEPFTVTLRNQSSRGILYVAITLRVADEASRHLLGIYMPEVRNRVLLELSTQDPLTVQTPDGRTRLATDLARVLRAPYPPQPEGPKISNVLFTAFVVQ
jgi:flagellar FliL protein